MTNIQQDATPRWAFMRIFRVKAGTTVYLTRFAIFQTPLLGLWLHRIHRRDLGYNPHNHPWNFLSLVLHGGYVEKFWADPNTSVKTPDAKLREHKRWSVKLFRRGWAHAIDKVDDDTLTLVIVGPHHNDWGFFTVTGFRAWDAPASPISTGRPTAVRAVPQRPVAPVPSPAPPRPTYAQWANPNRNLPAVREPAKNKITDVTDAMAVYGD